MLGAEEQIAVSQPEGGAAAEAALIRTALTGDRAALEQLLRPHRRSVVAICYGILGHPEEAEDAAQETFLRALRGLARFRGECAFRSWLLRIALHLCFSWKRSRRPTQSWEEEAFQSPDASPEVIAIGHLRLTEALLSLPPQRRAALLLKEWEGRTMAEIGALLGWNEDRVKNELYRARRAMVDWQERESEGETA